MIKFKWGIVAGVSAFVLAFITSLLLGQTNPLVALLRALSFGALFFGLGTGAWALIYAFIPDLLSIPPAPSAHKEPFHDIFAVTPPSGSQVNITLDDPLDSDDAHIDGMGSLNDLDLGDSAPAEKPAHDEDSSKDIDQDPIIGYSNLEVEEFSPELTATEKHEEEEFSVDFSSIVPDTKGAEEAGSVPDSSFPSVDDSFSIFSGGSSSAETENHAPSGRSVTGNKPVKFSGDFDPQKIAAGIRTVLEKDKR